MKCQAHWLRLLSLQSSADLKSGVDDFCNRLQSGHDGRDCIQDRGDSDDGFANAVADSLKELAPKPFGVCF